MSLPQYQDRQNVRTQLEANIVQRIAESFCPQYAGLFFGVHFEHTPPSLQVHHKLIEIVEIDSPPISFLERKHNH